MTFSLVAIIILCVVQNILIIIGINMLRNSIKENKALLEEIMNRVFALPDLFPGKFKCNVPPITEKDKPFVQTAPPWDDTPAPPEEG